MVVYMKIQRDIVNFGQRNLKELEFFQARGEKVWNQFKMEAILPAFIDVGEQDQVGFN